MTARDFYLNVIHTYQDHAITMLRSQEKHLAWIHQCRVREATWWKRILNFWFPTFIPYDKWERHTIEMIEIYKRRCDTWLLIDEDQDDQALYLVAASMEMELAIELGEKQIEVMKQIMDDSFR